MKAYSYIRFSTPEQAKGDSLRRQLDDSEAYAKKHGLILDEKLRMTDLGVSAFHGDHKTKGDLGRFLVAIEQGKIEPGSTLIVESLDRLSREKVLDALSQFLNIIRAGISIVTLQDERVYSKESIDNNFTELIVSIAIMARANEESFSKSKRLISAWENKRKSIQNGKKLTRQCPAWLRLNANGKQYEIIEGRDSVIQSIFSMKIDGIGTESIAKILNDTDGIWKPKNGWRNSYINKIIRSHAVIGIYQPHRIIEGKRSPIGDPIDEYFPQIIEEEKFFSVQKLLQSNRGNLGRIGKGINLFPHIAKCGLCKGPLVFINKGKPPKGGKYLICDYARRKVNDCSKPSIRYNDFETKALQSIQGLNIADLLPSSTEFDLQIDNLYQTKQKLIENINDIQNQIDNFVDQIGRNNSAYVRQKIINSIDKLHVQREKLKNDADKIDFELSEIESVKNKTESELHSLQSLIQHLEEVDKNDQYILREKLRSRLKKVVTAIYYYPKGQNESGIREIVLQYRAPSKKPRRTRFYWPK